MSRSFSPLPLGERGESTSIRTFGASDGYRWYYRRYAPVGWPRGRVVFAHGIRSHGGWYTRSCGELAAAGYEVFFLDRRGSGLNTARRGDAPGFRRLLDDVGEFVRDLRREQAALPIVLAGISWGGKLAAGLPYRRPGLVDGVALLCPGICPLIATPFGQRVRIARSRVRDPRRFYPIPLNEPELFTADTDWQRYIAGDPHGLCEATARFLASSSMFDVYLRRAARRLTVPTLLMLAEHDRVIDNARTRKWLVGVAARDRTIIDYAGAHHTLEFEPQGHPFVRDLIDWMRRRWG